MPREAETLVNTDFPAPTGPNAFSEPAFLGQAERREVDATYLGKAATTRVTTFNWHPSGALKSTVVQPEGGTDVELETTTTYTAEGLPQTVTVQDRSGSASGKRVTQIRYTDFERMFPQEVTNGLGQTERAVYHPVFGVPLWRQDANGRVVRTRLDGFGRTRTVDGPLDADVSMTYTREGPWQLLVTTTPAAGGKTKVGFDRLGRDVYKAALQANNTWTEFTTTFDDLGRVFGQTRPYGGTGYYYDSLGRLTKEARSDDSGGVAQKTTEYPEWWKTLTTDETGAKAYAIQDGLGQVLEKGEHLGNRIIKTSYEYEPFGLLGVVRHGTEGAQSATSMTYDVLGRRETLTTPDTGTTTTHYDAFGAPREETDAEGRVVTFEYDVLGRLRFRRDKDKAAPVVTTESRYDEAPGGLGALADAISPDGVRTVLAYDQTFGAVSATHQYMPGVPAPFEVLQGTDRYGRPEVLTYPKTSTGNRFEVRYEYSTDGLLKKVLDGSKATIPMLWEAVSREPLGRIGDERYGNGVTGGRSYYPFTGRVRSVSAAGHQNLDFTYDAAGQLRRRWDGMVGAGGLYESFSHDDLGRLTSWYSSDDKSAPVAGWRVDWTYDDRGNMTSRRTYPGPTGAELQGVTYTAGGNGYSPHQIASSSLWADEAFTYDKVGNVTRHPAAGTITYTPFNLPRTVTGATTVDYLYDAFGTRTRKRVGGSNGDTTIYVGGLYERRTVGSETSHVFMVEADGRVVAQVVRREPSGTQETSYVYSDPLRTTNVVHGPSGTEVRRQDPFGNRVTLSGTTLDARLVATPAGPPASGSVTRGFTGHEEEGDLGLVNMRGRIYDPRVGRMLQSDPLAGTWLTSQSWNPYSYAFNAPTDLTDPTGMDPCPGAAPEGSECVLIGKGLDFESQAEVDQKYPGYGYACRGNEKSLSCDLYVLSAPSSDLGVLNWVETRLPPASHRSRSCLDGSAEYCSGRVSDSFVQLDDLTPKGALKLSGAILLGGVKEVGKEVAEELAEKGAEKISKEVGERLAKEAESLGERAIRSGPFFKTNKAAAEAAEKLGFRKIAERAHGQQVFTDGKRFITRDVDGHAGGAWKMANSPTNLLRPRSEIT